MAFGVGFVHEIMQEDEHRVASYPAAICMVPRQSTEELSVQIAHTHLMIVSGVGCLWWCLDDANYQASPSSPRAAFTRTRTTLVSPSGCIQRGSARAAQVLLGDDVRNGGELPWDFRSEQM